MNVIAVSIIAIRRNSISSVIMLSIMGMFTSSGMCYQRSICVFVLYTRLWTWSVYTHFNQHYVLSIYGVFFVYQLFVSHHWTKLTICLRATKLRTVLSNTWTSDFVNFSLLLEWIKLSIIFSFVDIFAVDSMTLISSSFRVVTSAKTWFRRLALTCARSQREM